MKFKNWICIGWLKDSHGSVCKKLVARELIYSREALRAFKCKCPKLRNHTVQPEIETAIIFQDGGEVKGKG